MKKFTCNAKEITKRFNTVAFDFNDYEYDDVETMLNQMCDDFVSATFDATEIERKIDAENLEATITVNENNEVKTYQIKAREA